ncbi:CCDC158 multi-domain protein [Pyrenophora tritici-repentis]|uniref:CCDC158 multi-domain protein n=1 Tax=Pyrenophora tritici-repentis TaxID=45151 RepID=A0A922NGC7_9PLEO|nr:CCDC158 multi-domain protein [Pyrenophora tritici-repentis]KAI1670094.1 CCDC158 multi-domain protein [Pyrenophora tritici-repentis]KAI1681688.1 CCDC158 multi-domain protein [Pyrenophora tritici-repentis]
MNKAFEGAQSLAQRYPLAIAAGSDLALPGGFLLLTGKTTLSPADPTAKSSTSSPTLGSTATPLDCTANNTLQSVWPIFIPNGGLAANGLYRLISTVRDTPSIGQIAPGEGHQTELRHKALDFAFDLPLSTVIVTALPGTFLCVVRQLPDSWASRHQTYIANALHFIALASCANRKLEAHDLVIVVFVMVAFDMFQRVLVRGEADATKADESEEQPQQMSPVETVGAPTRSIPVNLAGTSSAKATSVKVEESEPVLPSQLVAADTIPTAYDFKDREIVRLQRSLTETKTSHKAKEVQLRITKEELHNAREALNKTFTEYTGLREELKIIKQNLGRDHQAIVYRKDIELFALRKGNEQKDKYILERDIQLEEMARQHKTTIEVKDAQLKLMKERLISVERQLSPRFSEEDGENALEVRLLRVRKGRASLEAEDEKDALIARLQAQLTVSNTTNEEIVNQQAELQRAWDIAKKIQKALKEERERHEQTREDLESAAAKLSEVEPQTRSRADSAPSRLPTIDEDEHDKNELEAMFDSTQQENLRLYAEVAALEKRLTDANARLFTAIQEVEALREQLAQEQTVNDDFEAARPSVVHRVHFQRMEGQLAEARDAVAAKEEEIELLRNTIAEKDHYVKDLKGEVDAAVNFHTQDQDEIDRLKQTIADLQATKYQLMLDHERLVAQRPRQHVISLDPIDRTERVDRTDRTERAERIDRTERGERSSARSSGATLIQELSPSARVSQEPMPVESMPAMPAVTEREGSIQKTPARHLRSKSTPKAIPARWTLMSQDAPPPELRELKTTQRRSLNLKGMMHKFVGKHAEPEKQKASEGPTAAETQLAKEKEAKLMKRDNSMMRRALAPRDRNVSARPMTSTGVTSLTGMTKPRAASQPLGSTTSLSMASDAKAQSPRPPITRRSTPMVPRYYASAEEEADAKKDEKEKENAAAKGKDADRPSTGVPAAPKEPSKHKSRLSWSATNKLKRRSLY